LTASARTIVGTESSISEYIPYSYHVDDDVISTKNGEYLSVWRLSGRSHQSASAEDVWQWLRELNQLVRGMASGVANIAFYSHTVRREVFEYPESEFDNIFCRQLDAKYRASFDGKRMMVNELYLTVVLRPQTDPILGFFAKRERLSADQMAVRQAQAIKTLQDANSTIEQSLKRYGAELLGQYERDGYIHSTLIEFLALLVNGEKVAMPVVKKHRIADCIALNRVLFATHGEIGEIRGLQRSRAFGMLEIAEYDEGSEPGQLNGLMEAPFEFVLTQSFATLGTHAAKGFLSKHQRHLQDANDAGQRQVEEITLALDQLVSGKFVMGEHHCSLLVYGEDADEVRDNLAAARAMFLDVAIVPKTVDAALEAGFWAQLPCNWVYRPRPAPITSENFLCFSPFHNFMSGKPNNNPWGPAVTVLKTVSGTPLYFNFHVSNEDDDSTDKRLVGNTMFIGQSGSGKTVLLGFLMAQAQKFRPTIVAFDKDRGMEVAIRAMGGRYLPLKTGVPSGFNPLQLAPTPANLLFLKQFISTLAKAGGPVTHRDEREIDDALKSVMELDKEDRRLSTLIQGLPDPRDPDATHPTVAARLRKWTVEGELGWLFDNPSDALNLDTHRLYGFDVTEFLDNDETRGPLMMYLTYRTEGMIDGRRFMYVFDEFWKALSDPYFEDLAKNKQKTIRKQNGIFVFATQEPGDALASPIAKTLIQQTATFVFLPNPGADREDYVDRLKLTETEFDLVRGLGESSRRFLIKQGGGAAIAELNLGGFDDELLVLSGTPDMAELVEQIVAEVGDDPAVWLPIFTKRAREGVA
jgi:type IV secretion system protein VirB4